MTVARNKHAFWEFYPKYIKDETVWWVDTLLRTGTVIGLYFEHTDRVSIMFQIKEVSGETSRIHDINQDSLFDTKEELIVYLESH